MLGLNNSNRSKGSKSEGSLSRIDKNSKDKHKGKEEDSLRVLWSGISSLDEDSGIERKGKGKREGERGEKRTATKAGLNS